MSAAQVNGGSPTSYTYDANLYAYAANDPVNLKDATGLAEGKPGWFQRLKKWWRILSCVKALCNPTPDEIPIKEPERPAVCWRAAAVDLPGLDAGCLFSPAF